MTIQEVAQCLGKSDATIRRWIKQGKLESTLTDGKYDIPESAIDAYTKSEARLDTIYTDEGIDQAGDHLRRQNDNLLKQVADQQARIEKLEEQLENERTRYDTASERHDLVIIQMARQMDGQQQLLLEHKEPWYRKMFRRRRSEDDMDNVMDMKPGTDKES